MKKNLKNIPVIDLTYQYQQQRTEILAAVEQVFDKGQYILGEHVSLLEQEIASFCGTKYGVGVANGTDAITLTLRACNIGVGDEVITTPFTFFATAESIMQVGATPVFVDIDPDTYTIDTNKIVEKITPKTKAILPVHLFGQMADMPEIRRIADSHNLYVIEDACQAIGAEWNNQGIGHYGDAAAISFFPTKNLGGYGDGGMVVVSNEEVANRIRRLRVHGSKKKYIHEELGWNSRLDELQAAILRVKLTRLREWNQQRRMIAERYNQAFSTLPIQTPVSAKQAYHIYHLYTIQTDRRDELQDALETDGIGSGVYYPLPLHLQAATQQFGYQPGDLPAAESASKRCLSLPMYPGLDEEDQNYVIERVTQFFKE